MAAEAEDAIALQLFVIDPLLEVTTSSTELTEHIGVPLSTQGTTVPLELNLNHESCTKKY